MSLVQSRIMDDLYRRVFRFWRARRFELFVREIRPTPNQTLLDAGGLPAFWIGRPPVVGRLDIVNLLPLEWDPEAATAHNIHVVRADARCLPMADGSYDIAFSNSVIEHVGGWPDQVAFARELRRVGRAVWVQTPAFECPLEPHYLAPFVHYLPRSVQRRILRWLTPWGWLARPDRAQVDLAVDTTRLLRRPEMARLFPDCEIRTERLLGVLPKSYVAIRRGTAVRSEATD